MQRDDVRQGEVLSAFGVLPSACAIAALGSAGGFSGARLWRIQSNQQTYCLRRWPAEQDATRLRFVHGVLEFAGMQLDFVPRLQRTAAGETIVEAAGHAWELATWLPGEANFHQQPTAARLAAAMTALARLHVAWEYFPTRMTGLAASPGIGERLTRLAEIEQTLPAIEAALPRAAPDLRALAIPLVAHFRRRAGVVRGQLQAATQRQAMLQPVLRDIWHDHVLFSGEAVTGIVDFGAVRIDTVATDLARLLGSLVGDDATAWQQALLAYEAIRPLSADERALLPAFDASTTLMSGMNWLVWLLVDARQFDDWPAIYRRWEEILRRLDHAGKQAPIELG